MNPSLDDNPYRPPTTGVAQSAASSPEPQRGNLPIQGIRVGSILGGGIPLLLTAVFALNVMLNLMWPDAFALGGLDTTLRTLVACLLVPSAGCVTLGAVVGGIAQLEERVRGELSR